VRLDVRADPHRTCPICRFSPLKTDYFWPQPTVTLRRACPVRPLNRRYKSAVRFWGMSDSSLSLRASEDVRAKNEPPGHLLGTSMDNKKFGILAGHGAASPKKSPLGLRDLLAGGAAIEEGRNISLYKGRGCIRRDSKGVPIIYINIRVGQLDLLSIYPSKSLGINIFHQRSLAHP